MNATATRSARNIKQNPWTVEGWVNPFTGAAASLRHAIIDGNNVVVLSADSGEETPPTVYQLRGREAAKRQWLALRIELARTGFVRA